jgi:hypothetical protein
LGEDGKRVEVEGWWKKKAEKRISETFEIIEGRD